MMTRLLLASKFEMSLKIVWLLVTHSNLSTLGLSTAFSLSHPDSSWAVAQATGRMKSLSVRTCLGGIRQQLWRSERADDTWQGHLGLCSEESTGLWNLLRHNTSSDSLLDGTKRGYGFCLWLQTRGHGKTYWTSWMYLCFWTLVTQHAKWPSIGCPVGTQDGCGPCASQKWIKWIL